MGRVNEARTLGLMLLLTAPTQSGSKADRAGRHGRSCGMSASSWVAAADRSVVLSLRSSDATKGYLS